MVDLNEDLSLSEHFEPFLKKAVSKGREIGAGSILQVQGVSNISAARQDGKQSYEGTSHVLKVTLTDGESTVYGLIIEPIPRFTLNTRPGTKIKFVNNAPLHGQLVLITPSNVQYLGGEVPKLIEKWEFQKKMDIKKEWGALGGVVGGSEGPPMWRPFGQKTAQLDVAMLRKMKAMDIVNEKKDGAEPDANQTQFQQQRHEAISELMEKSVKQKWQKPNKHLVDKELQDIMDEGFTYDEASNALNRFKNLQKALKFLKASKGDFSEQRAAQEERREKRRKNAKDNDEDDDAPIPREYQRPSNNISLFGFIADTIHIKGGDTESGTNQDDRENSERSETDYRYEGRGGRRGRGRGGSYNSGSDRGFRGRGGRGDYRGGRDSDRGGQRNSSSYDNRTDSRPSPFEEKPSEGYGRQDSNHRSRGGGRYDSGSRGGRGSSRGFGDSRSNFGNRFNNKDDQDFPQVSNSEPRTNSTRGSYQDARNNYSQQPPPRFQRSQQFSGGAGDEPQSYNSYSSSNSNSQFSDKYQPQPRGGGGRGGAGYGGQGNRQGGSSSYDQSNSSDSWNPRPMVFSRGGTSGRGRGQGNYY